MASRSSATQAVFTGQMQAAAAAAGAPGNGVIIRPSELPGLERLERIVMACVNDPLRGVPALIGPTQWGKTRWIVDLVRRMEMVPVMVNPQNDLPEDLAGWPVRATNVHDGREVAVLRFTQPSIIPPEFLRDDAPRWALIVDELDKAREDTLSSLLTLFNPDERRLRHTRIPNHVPIFVAMNEPVGRQLPDPLIARLMFLEFPPKGFSLEGRDDLRVVMAFAGEVCSAPTIRFPQRPSAPGSLHKLVRWFEDRLFWEDEQYRHEIVRGLFSEKDTAIVLSRLNEQRPEPTEMWAKSVNLVNLPEQLYEVLNVATFEQSAAIMKIIIDRSNSDPTGEWERVLIQFLTSEPILRGIHDEHTAATARQKIREVFASKQIPDAQTPVTTKAKRK